ncbi:bifunctional phosphoribosyl-AMP cyclohydrolase/phosphoribosyl-ATP diphosphatase HisIE [Paracrocinitomix mangrovi]|uniref:bifunctional phosphoribosyl-AMP cyclohydrolase/phosphoribosyl-ATP diphosphatase HisIE n=1 Tax=Paracrocinitomix mangrovi TaxID=2862509 RepID=UPI001C8E4350|nr:bifunctional phosphoribosyl-AMP cyclohydrolase/phosphoribosyl-ATP diphosphatase HisIE [Paracrocinitomix mangrovi]UKN02297.1 bifunctional phosphoribosyl-AMP cyclohydrolase/phosphoribosyl-ATP diphosphatase HisIE [Paracrocinitomix mangrovi]
MNLKFDNNQLIPAIIQDAKNKSVLMLGYMNQEAFELTKTTNRVTFYSRSKERIWVKGESSGNYLELVDIKLDCDNDALLITVNPQGPTCHKGTASCWGDVDLDTIQYLEKTIQNRQESLADNSYVSSLFKKGINKIAQKVGEEAVEVVIESKDDNDELFLNESADLFFHFLILLRAKNFNFSDVLNVLESRKN